MRQLKLTRRYAPHSLRANSLFGGYREKWTRERHAKGDAKAGNREEKGELATITHKFSFPTRKSRDTAKRGNCHRKLAAD